MLTSCNFQSGGTGPWSFVRFSAKKILPQNFDLDRFLRESGITIDMVPHLVELKHTRSYRLVVATPCLEALARFNDFELVLDHDPFEPAEEDVCLYGIWEAEKRARMNTLTIGAEAIRNGWGCGPAECYRKVSEDAGLRIALERAILNWDIQVRYPHIHLPPYMLRTSRMPTLGSSRVSRKTSFTFA